MRTGRGPGWAEVANRQGQRRRCDLVPGHREPDRRRLQGDLDSADVRRSRAIGILAQPALALDLLWQFRDEQQPAAEPQQPDEPVDNDPGAPFDRSTGDSTDDLLPDSLVVRPSGLDQRRLRPQVVLHHI